MADSNGQKPIRNTLLSGATGASFFEEAAMLIPVPVVEPQSIEPATAEIDLNSDDSSSNRGSVEKEFTDVLNLNEDGDTGTPPVEEPAPPISLFSRAATSVDAFSKMLAGSAKPDFTPKAEIKPQPAVVQLTTPTLSTPLAGDVSALGGPRPQELTSTPPVAAPSPILNTATPPPAASAIVTLDSSSKQGDDGQIPSASSIFSSGTTSTASLFSTGNSSFFPSNPPAPTFPPASSTPQPSAFAPVVTAGNANPPFIPNAGPPSTSPATAIPPTASTTNIPSASTPNIPSVPLIPPGSLNLQSNAPPAQTGGSNAFRLGSQRMKYVPCPEMQSTPAPPVQSFYRPPDAIQPPINSPPAGHSAFSPPQNSFNTSSPTIPSTPSPTVSSISLSSGHQNPLSSPTSSNASLAPVVNNPSAYFQPSGMTPYGPQELPPLTFHWFYKKDLDGKATWKPFSIIDSVALEDAYANDPERLVPTDGGRYDVCVKKRIKTPVYWEEAPIEVRRGSWFYKGPMDNRFVPYDEDFALRLEQEYADCMKTGSWQKRLEFPEGESVIMHSAGVVVHFCQAAAPDDWGNLPESQIRPRVVKRGVEEIEMEDGESTQIDHLVFVVHGIGPICDFKLRNIVEAVDDFRGLSIQLLNSHFRESMEKNLVGRVEFLPVSWHKALHGDKGIDEQLKRITLKSIPKFRDFTNDTLLDILFYTSPVYCQTIIDSVGSELNRIYKLFLSRNPSFKGKVSLTGHSLGSLILFDLLAHQPQLGTPMTGAGDSVASVEGKQTISENQTVSQLDTSGSSSRTVSYTVGTAGTGQPYITYPTIDFNPTAFFALGSPIAMFVTVRGIEQLGNDFRMPTCPAFFNIFHPYDPVAYRIETLIDPNFQSRPVLIPHHKGRKRIHLELKETMARVGADIKHRVIDAVKNTLNTVYHYTGFNKSQENLENEIQTAIVGEMEKKSEADGAEDENAHIRIGSLNGGRRIDYVLQEAPYETFNEYVFAMSTHVGYWESEDTMLLILTEIYSTMGIQRDRQISGTAQSVSSPTHPLPSSTQVLTGAGSYSQGYGLGHSSNGYASAFQPSAPPATTFGDFQAPTLVSQLQSPLNQYVSPPTMPTTSPAVPMIPPTNTSAGVLLPPTPTPAGVPSPNKPFVIGNRPVADPTTYPRGMDPTAPMLSTTAGPPPKVGFVPKKN